MSFRLRRAIRRLAADQRGLTSVEYVIVLCLIAAATVSLWGNLGETEKKSLKASNTDIAAELKTK